MIAHSSVERAMQLVAPLRKCFELLLRRSDREICEVISLPLGPTMTMEEVAQVVEVVRG